MKNENKDIFAVKIFGIGLMILALGFVIRYLLANEQFSATIAFGFLSVGLAFFSIGLSMESHKISEKSKEIAKESRDRMKSLVNVKFGEVKGAIEDRRLKLREQRGKIEEKKKKRKDTFDDGLDLLFIHSFGIWKCYTFLEQALELKAWLERADEKQLIDHICMFFDELRYDGIALSKENLHHIDMIYNSVSQLDRLTGDKELENKLKKAYDALKSNKK